MFALRTLIPKVLVPRLLSGEATVDNYKLPRTYTLQAKYKSQRYIHVTNRSFGTNGAVGTQRRLGTTPIIDGRTQWMSLSATIDNRSNREPPRCTYSIVLLAPRHTGRVRAYTVMDQKWSVAVPVRLVPLGLLGGG